MGATFAALGAPSPVTPPGFRGFRDSTAHPRFRGTPQRTLHAAVPDVGPAVSQRRVRRPAQVRGSPSSRVLKQLQRKARTGAKPGAGCLLGTNVASCHLHAKRGFHQQGLAASWFGPHPPTAPLTAEELYAADFAREFEREGDPRLMSYSDNIRDCADAGDWEGAVAALNDMWKCELDPDAWSYGTAIDACVKANESDALAAAETLRDELQSFGQFPNVVRFQLTPMCKWHRQLKRAGCACHNTLDWKGRDPLPKTDRPVWLLPAQDDEAEHIAENEHELREQGWKLLTCDRDLVARLRSKTGLQELAKELGLAALMPQRYDCAGDAEFPCILKPSRGTWGKNIHIVHSSEEVLRIIKPGKIYEVERQVEQQAEYMSSYSDLYATDNEDAWAEQAEKIDQAVREWIEQAEWEDLGSNWLLQELAVGRYEYSTTLLVSEGEILDYAASQYNFSSEVYVWPALEYDSVAYVSVHEQHLAAMKALLAGFSGICNFNYKLRPDGQMCIFEMNPRVGGDLVFDMPKRRVRAMLEKMDVMLS